MLANNAISGSVVDKKLTAFEVPAASRILMFHRAGVLLLFFSHHAP
jgi:hypothetical protein